MIQSVLNQMKSLGSYFWGGDAQTEVEVAILNSTNSSLGGQGDKKVNITVAISDVNDTDNENQDGIISSISNWFTGDSESTEKPIDYDIPKEKGSENKGKDNENKAENAKEKDEENKAENGGEKEEDKGEKEETGSGRQLKRRHRRRH